MTASRRNKRSDQPHETAPGGDDLILAALRETEARYVDIYTSLSQQSVEARQALTKVREDNEGLTQEVAALRRELDDERRRVQHQRQTVDTLASALNDIHRSLFGGNVYASSSRRA